MSSPRVVAWQRARGVRPGRRLRLRAAWHEVRCAECRVTWRSWLQRVVNNPRGFSPEVKR